MSSPSTSSPKLSLVGGPGGGGGGGRGSTHSGGSGGGKIPSNFMSSSATSNLPKFNINDDDEDDDIHQHIQSTKSGSGLGNNNTSSSSNSAYSGSAGNEASSSPNSLNNSKNNIGESTSAGGGRTRLYEDYNDILQTTGTGYSHHKDRHCSTYANRVLFSNKYYYAYIFMIFINLVLIAWLIVNLVQKSTNVPTHWLFVLLDILVNVSLFIEISLQIVSQKRRYFNSWSNIFDCIVLVFSIAGLFMYLLSKKDHQFDFEGIIIIFFTALRYVVQFLRLLAMIKRQKLKSSTFNSRVDFTELKDTDLVFDVDASDF